MDFTGISVEHMIYGTLFSLAISIQMIGDSTFSEMTMKQHFVLIALGMFDEAPTLRELSDIAGSSYQNVKRMIVALEKEGYVALERDESDHRKCRVVAKKKAQNFQKKLIP